MTLAIGDKAPNFTLPSATGAPITLADVLGRRTVVLFFYPKDDTPGCTTQGKSFTAAKSDFDAAGIKVVGVSSDDVTSHKNFSHKFAFTIDLLSDTNSTLMKTLGLGQAEWKGMKFWERTSFVVDPKGIIRKVYEKVNPDGHERVLLDDIQGMQTKAA